MLITPTTAQMSSDIESSTAPLSLVLKAGFPRNGHDAQRKASPFEQLPQPPAGASSGGASFRTPVRTASSISFRLQGRGAEKGGAGGKGVSFNPARVNFFFRERVDETTTHPQEQFAHAFRLGAHPAASSAGAGRAKSSFARSAFSSITLASAPVASRAASAAHAAFAGSTKKTPDTAAAAGAAAATSRLRSFIGAPDSENVGFVAVTLPDSFCKTSVKPASTKESTSAGDPGVNVRRPPSLKAENNADGLNGASLGPSVSSETADIS